MTESGEFSHSFEVGELIDTASAVAERQLQDAAARRRLMEELTGYSIPEVPADIQGKLGTALAAMNISRIESPNSPMSYEESLDSVMGGSYEAVAEWSGSALNGEQLREFALNLGKTLMSDMGMTDEQLAQGFVQMFEAAKTIAREAGVSVAQVYRNDELYRQVFQRLHTPEEFAAKAVRQINGISEAAMKNILMQMQRSSMAMEEHPSEEELTAMMMQMQLDPTIMATIRQSTELVVKLTKQDTVSQIIRFWGQEALHNLPAELQERLSVSESLAIQAGALAIEGVAEEAADIERMRESFSVHYFEERGWDINNPTDAQLAEVHAQPGWQNPSR